MSNDSMHYHVLILAAGKGVRMRSCLPKVLHKLNGRTLLERVVRAAVEIKPAQITVVIGPQPGIYDSEIARCASLAGSIALRTVVQSDQNGTGGAVKAALSTLGESVERVLILPGDAPLITGETLKEILEGDRRSDTPELLVVSCVPPSPFGYGRILRDARGSLQGIVEERDCTPEQKTVREINASLYCAQRDFLSAAVNSLRPANAQQELYLPDAAAFGVKNNHHVAAVKLSRWEDVAGVNTRVELAELERLCRERVNRSVMEHGATLEDPATTFIEESVEVESDCFIGSGTRLRGTTVIRSGSVIDGSSVIIDSEIGPAAHIRFSCVLEGARVGKDCLVGPFARLRPGTVLHDGVHIGDFVETKNAELCTGAKANHLAYIGDSYIGERVNIGAGTITCNYDGVNKYRTRIEAGAFIGSNTALIAPVVIGAGAVVGAGSVITKDVPADALGIERSAQVNKEGWAREKRERQKKL